MHRETGVAGKPFGPIHLPNRIEEGIEIGGGEFGHLDLDPVGDSQPNVGPANVQPVPLKLDLPRLDDVRLVAELLQLPFKGSLQGERA